MWDSKSSSVQYGRSHITILRSMQETASVGHQEFKCPVWLITYHYPQVYAGDYLCGTVRVQVSSMVDHISLSSGLCWRLFMWDSKSSSVQYG